MVQGSKAAGTASGRSNIYLQAVDPQDSGDSAGLAFHIDMRSGLGCVWWLLGFPCFARHNFAASG